MTILESFKPATNDYAKRAVLYRLMSPSGAVYIGQTRQLRGRLANYRCVAKGTSVSSQPLLSRSLLKYGLESHKLEILHRMPYDIDQKFLDIYERRAILSHRKMRLLNVSAGGGGTKPHRTVRHHKRPDVQGEKHPLAKLTEENVIAIRCEYRKGSRDRNLKALAARYAVSVRLICNVLDGTAWRHVPTSTDIFLASDEKLR